MTSPPGLRSAIAWVCVGLTYVIALSYYKSSTLQQLSQQSVQTLQERTHSQVSSLFQASYYFFFDDQFVPGVKRELLKETYPQLTRVRMISNSGGALLFDSDAPKKPSESQGDSRDNSDKSDDAISESTPFQEKAVLAHLEGHDAAVFFDGFKIEILMPGAQYGVLYTFSAGPVRTRILLALIIGLLVGLGVHWALSRDMTHRLGAGARVGWGRIWRLRIKLLATIVLVNLLTAGVVFVSLSRLQTEEQSRKLERDSVLFSQFSTSQVISNFNSHFYSHFSDRFIPETKKIIASNENLVGIRIRSHRTGGVLFDSEQTDEASKSVLPAEIHEQLKSRDLVVGEVRRNGEPLLSVVNTFRNESQEPLFWVEYLFSSQTLVRSIQTIRTQLLLDLIPSLVLGFLVAVVFAQLLISPIRKIAAALGRVSSGDYEAHIDLKRNDELGELVGAFNSMTEELRKKKELRKYLSDSTYRMVMKSAAVNEGARIGGTRVSATVLFSDIRGFVSHCETMEAEEVTTMLNEYFSEMVDVIHKHGGEVDKFIGDALLAVFYASEDARTIGKENFLPSASGTALQGIYCALEMRERLVEFNAKRVAAGKLAIDTGVGITFGELISGPIGSKDRMDFTVIGDVVNLASRIEKLSKDGRHTKIVFSHQVEEKVRGLLEYEQMDTSQIKGKEETVGIYELVGVRDIRYLVENLRTDDLQLRRRSVELLGHSRNEEALGWVIGLLADSDEGTRLQAVLSVSRLGKKQDNSAFDALIARFSKEKSDKVLSALITAVGKLTTFERTARMIEVLQAFLDSPNERIVANAIEALGQSRSPQSTDLILPKLMSRNNRIKANAAMAMFAAGHIEVIDTLKPMLMHSDPLMRSSAAFAIGELTSIAEQDQIISHWKPHSQMLKVFLAELQECVPMLVACLRDAEPMVRRQAVIALGKIKDKSAVLPMIDMLDPSQASGKELIQDISQALRSIGSHKLVREVIAKLSSSN